MLNTAACQDIVWLLQGLSPNYFERIYPGYGERVMAAARHEICAYLGETFKTTKDFNTQVVKLINLERPTAKATQRWHKLRELYAECKAIAEPGTCDIMDALISASATANFQNES